MIEHPLPFHKLKIQKKKSLVAIIENVIKGGENHMFRNLYAIEDGKEVDILEDGGNSCGVFVSWILLALELIKRPHATVYATEMDLVSSGWYKIKDLKAGAVLVWEDVSGDLLGEKAKHRHIGFYIGNDMAVSSDSVLRTIVKHHYTYEGKRKIEKIFWHSELDNE